MHTADAVEQEVFVKDLPDEAANGLVCSRVIGLSGVGIVIIATQLLYSRTQLLSMMILDILHMMLKSSEQWQFCFEAPLDLCHQIHVAKQNIDIGLHDLARLLPATVSYR